ncbi:MAG: hypothetical protein ACI9MR_000338 [Myxococcota bacterium]|jgi:hypothetical protein
MLRLANSAAAFALILCACSTKRASAPEPPPPEWVHPASGARFIPPGDGWSGTVEGKDGLLVRVERAGCIGEIRAFEGPNDYAAAKSLASKASKRLVADGHAINQDRKLLFSGETGHRLEVQQADGDKTHAQRLTWWPVGERLFELRAVAQIGVSTEARRCLDTITLSFDFTVPRRK